MAKHRVAYLARSEVDVTTVRQGLDGLDYELTLHVCDSPGETIEAVKGVDVIITSAPVPREVIEQIDTAKAIVSMGHGFDRIDHDAATERGVMVVNTAGFCTEEVANHAIMLLLACAKKLITMHQLTGAGDWRGAHARIAPMPQIYGEVLGLVGLGNIARATANRAKALGMVVIAHDPYVSPWTAKEYRVELVATLDELAARSDFVSIHTPLNKETEKLLGESFFDAMKPTAFFINTCRGPTVDERALIQALRDGKIAGAGLDVFEQEPTPPDNPLLHMENVIVTPHSAGYSDASIIESELRVGQEAARILRGSWPLSLVNPEVRAKIPSRRPAVNT